MQLFILTIFAAATAASTLPGQDIGEALSIADLNAIPGAKDVQVDTSSSNLATGFCLSQTNAARAQNGLGPLIADTRLETASRNHNNVMVSQNCFSHQCPGEPSFGDRIRAAGYSWTNAGENIAAGYADCNAVLNGWMNSPGHRANILGRDFVHVGCHMATCSGCSFRTYFTCEYARHR